MLIAKGVLPDIQSARAQCNAVGYGGASDARHMEPRPGAPLPERSGLLNGFVKCTYLVLMWRASDDAKEDFIRKAHEAARKVLIAPRLITLCVASAGRGC